MDKEKHSFIYASKLIAVRKMSEETGISKDECKKVLKKYNYKYNKAKRILLKELTDESG